MNRELRSSLTDSSGKKGRIFIFTMTRWDEQPRLRHQVAKLLADAGEEVHFFQGSRYPWKKAAVDDDIKISDNLHVHRAVHIIHAHLRVHPLLISMDGAAERLSIRKIIGGNPRSTDVVINFNYDFYFLRKIFQDNIILTIINDDFIAQAKFFQGSHVRESLKNTCAISDAVLAVSYPLIDQLQNWCKPTLFLPWADVKYQAPKISAPLKDAVLLWAYIDIRIDFNLLREVAKALPASEFHVYGNRFFRIESEVEKCLASPNIIFRPASRLDDIDISRYYAAVIPYKSGVADIEAVTLSNKSFQLLARGLPLVTSGMPHFFQHASICNTVSIKSFVDALKQFQISFWELQPLIENLVGENMPATRYEQLRGIWLPN